MLDCTITVPSGGSGRGCLKSPKTAKVSELIRDLEAYYKAIYKHCLECRDCDPNEVLKRFLERRDAPTSGRKGTHTTALLVEMAAKYVKNVPGTDKDWFRKYLLRCNSLKLAVKHREALTKQELVEKIMDDQGREWIGAADFLDSDQFLTKSLRHLEYVRQQNSGFNDRGWVEWELSSFNASCKDAARRWAFKTVVAVVESGCRSIETVEELKKMMPVAECMMS